MKLRRYVPPYKQKNGSDDCGPTCVRMVINSFLPREQRHPKKRFGKGRKTKESLKRMIENLGFHFSEISGQAEEDSRRFLREAIRKNRPVILSCRSYFKYYKRDSHYMVLKGIDKKYIYVNDPYPEKPTKIDIDDFVITERPKRETRWGRTRWAIAVYK